MIRGVADSVRRIKAGSATMTAVAIGDTVIQVADASDFPDPTEGGALTVLISGQQVAYTAVLPAEDYTSGVTVDTLVLAAPATAAIAANVRVDVPDSVRYQAQVLVGDDYEPAWVSGWLITHTALKVASGHLDTPVYVSEDDDGEWHVTGVADRDPAVDAGFTAPGTLKLSTAHDPADITDSNVVSDWINESNLGGATAKGLTLATPGGVALINSNSLSGLIFTLIAQAAGTPPPPGVDGGTL